MRNPGMSGGSLLPLILFVLAVTSFVLAYLAGTPDLQGSLFNPDALYLPTLFTDLFSAQGHLADWHLPPAPGFFPDYSIYLIAHLLGHDAYTRILLYAVLQILLLFAALGYLEKQLGTRTGILVPSTIVTLLIWLGLKYPLAFSLIFSSAHHFGILVSAILILAIWLQYEQATAKSHDNGRAWVPAALVFVLIFLGSLSDRLFVVQVAIPFLLTVLLVHRDPPARIAGLLFLILICTGLGLLTYGLLVPHPVAGIVGNDPLSTNLTGGNFSGIYWLIHDRFLDHRTIVIILASSLVFVVYSLLKDLVHPDRRLSRGFIFLVLFALFSSSGTILVLTFLRDLPVSLSDLIPVVFWPIILLIIALDRLFRDRFILIGFIVLALSSGILLVHSLHLIGKSDSVGKYYPEQVSCIDDALEQSGSRNGIAQYSDAKYLFNFSRLTLNIAQFTAELVPDYRVTTRRYFKGAYDFAIVSDDARPGYKLSTDLLAGYNDHPERVVTCGNKTLYLYGADQLRIPE